MRKSLVVLCLVCFWLSVSAQSSAEAWQEMLANLSSQSPSFKIVIQYQDDIKKINGNSSLKLWEACSTLEVLDNPTCRCLPEPQGRVIFCFEENQMVTIEVVTDHWFNGVYLGKGRVLKFILKDEKNKFFDMVEKLMKPSTSSNDPCLCPECAGKMFISSIGRCSSCSSATSSGAFKLCGKCARAKGVCQACQKAMK